MLFLRLTVVLLGLCTLGLPLTGGVDIRDNAFPNGDVFGITFGPEQSFYGRVGAVNAVSLQEYTTGQVVVLEMNIDLQGSVGQLRIYHTRPLTLDDVRSMREAADGDSPVPLPAIGNLPAGLNDLANRAGNAAEATANRTVVKGYPLATHARTLEFAVGNRADLVTLYQAFRDRWLRRPQPGEAEGDESGEASRRGLNRVLFAVDG
ncbi:MAG: hypothetical protein ACFE0O_14410 [Opitutales bacterium]